MKLFSTRIKGKTRIVTFQPGNKDLLSTVDSINAAGRAIPSFLILTAKALLEEYVMADIDDRVVLTHMATGFNNAQRGRQWLQHFNYHSFDCSDNFTDFTIETWFGYGPDLTRETWNERLAYSASKMTRKSDPIFS
ncbi:hypothetical protein BKA56DRAFT_626289 [Ilyonectria sp. MPI-CAGE-AT-0026]|nr:hypothetical protein BKA56DRAFT_626289 [Ilyonectria sp. MPI-CAGE-AT-0026]